MSVTCSNSNGVLNDEVTPDIRFAKEKLPAPKLKLNDKMSYYHANFLPNQGPEVLRLTTSLMQ